jgi:hypothetical protein
MLLQVAINTSQPGYGAAASGGLEPAGAAAGLLDLLAGASGLQELLPPSVR